MTFTPVIENRGANTNQSVDPRTRADDKEINKYCEFESGLICLFWLRAAISNRISTKFGTEINYSCTNYAGTGTLKKKSLFYIRKTLWFPEHSLSLPADLWNGISRYDTNIQMTRNLCIMISLKVIILFAVKWYSFL